MNRFIDQRKDNWQRLEDVLGMLRGSSLRGLSRTEVREFGELYRRAAADLAIARAESRDPKLVTYLNGLVIRAHGKIYRAEGEGLRFVAAFFARDLPKTVRANFSYMAIAAGIFIAAAVFGFTATWLNTDFTQFVGLAGVTEAISKNEKWWLTLNDGNQIGASFILSNNIIVTIRAFAGGAFFGIGAVYDLASFGAQLGSIFAACFKLNPAFGSALAGFVIGHGVLEISVVLLSAGAGMMIGYALINPRELTRRAALKKKGIEAARIVVGSAFFLVIAGVIEGFISPSSLPNGYKIATGVLTGVMLYTYLFLAGRGGDERRSRHSILNPNALISRSQLTANRL